MSHLKTNRESWNQRVETHFNSKFYDVPGFLAGNTSLNDIELNSLTDVAGKTLLHLQCHFGLDSLSWARLGANVTGVDISDVAITKANDLQTKTGLNAKFVAADVYQFGLINQQQFDVVFTSYGAICWLPDLTQWAQVVASSLNTGGSFFMAEFHPVMDLISGYSYFHNPDPDLSMEDTYTENADGSQHEFAVWSHPISDVLNALIEAGMQIEACHEYDYSPYNCFPNMQESHPGQFSILHEGQKVPVVYAVKATKAK